MSFDELQFLVLCNIYVCIKTDAKIQFIWYKELIGGVLCVIIWWKGFTLMVLSTFDKVLENWTSSQNWRKQFQCPRFFGTNQHMKLLKHYLRHAHTNTHTYLTNPPTQGSFFKWSLTGLNSIFLQLDRLSYQIERAQSVLFT